MELWIQSKEFPDYEVSSNGRVRNIKTGRIMKTNISDKGYERVSLRKDNKPYTKPVHRLVGDAFFDGDHDGLDINHIDGNKTNNFVGNLEWCTRKENIQHAYATGLKEEPRRTKVRVVETGRIYNSVLECSKDTGCDRSTIHKCLNGKARIHKGYHFESVL